MVNTSILLHDFAVDSVQTGSVYDVNGISPTLLNQHGNAVTKVAIEYSRKVGVGRKLDTAHTLSASDWRGLNRNQTQNAVLEASSENTLTHRIRKLTPLECWRLQGFTDEQFKSEECGCFRLSTL